MARIKLTKSAVDAAKPQAQAIELRDTVVPGFLCKITPAGRKVFMLQYRTNAGERRKPAWPVRRTDRRAGPCHGAGVAGRGAPGGDPSAAKAAARRHTMKEYCHTFMEDYSKQRNKPSTQRGYQGVIDRHHPDHGADEGAGREAPGRGRADEEAGPQAGRGQPHLRRAAQDVQPGRSVGLRPDGTNPCRHVPMFPPGKETRLIVDDELVRIFRHLEHLEAEGLENYVIPLAIRLQFEFAARRSEICPLEWGWVDLEKRRVVWPDSKTGGISKPMSEEAYRLLSTAPRREAPLRPAVAQRPGPASDAWRTLWRLEARAQGRRRAACRHARHPPSSDDRHCQLRRANQSGHEALVTRPLRCLCTTYIPRTSRCEMPPSWWRIGGWRLPGRPVLWR